MKKALKYSAIIALCLFAFNFIAVAGDRNASHLSKLPSTAQQMVKKNFSNYKVVRVETKNSLLNKTYEVTFSNGFQIKFDKNGEWTQIDCKRSEVPSKVVPRQISDYVKHNHKSAKICEIERQKNRYDIELTNGLRVSFDKNFAVTKIR